MLKITYFTISMSNDWDFLICSYVMGVGEAEEFSERLKRELQALEAANVHAILESEPLINEVLLFSELTAFFFAVNTFLDMIQLGNH